MPNDAVFRFPCKGRKTLELWASQSVLARASDYFESMFQFHQSDDSMAPASSSVEAEGDLPSHLSIGHEKGNLDEGSETDQVQEFLAYHGEKVLKHMPNKLHEVVITEHSYTSYRTLVHYLYTREPVKFHTIRTARQNSLQIHFETPQPSVKSVYRLAHELRVDGLKQLALESYISQISVENIEEELFCTFALAYEEVHRPWHGFR